jgi:ADP-dependent NAD(P)H-hydrate dehydratase / NAD(P)H-hydrate epimerase
MKRHTVCGRAGVAALSAAAAAEQDRRAREVLGIPERVLMESAGRALALVLNRLYPRGRVLAVVGRGHNGGDAIVALRILASWGREVAWLPVDEPPAVAELAHGHALRRVAAEAAGTALGAADVVMDGMLGTGARGAPRAAAAALIRQLNAAGRPVVAVDLPSGVDPTTGAVPGEAVAAAVTVSFGWPKIGLLLQPARARCGRLVVAEIGFPPLDAEPAAELATPGWAAARLPRRDAAAHKGTAGKVLILAGRAGMAGAAVIAARAASRAGAGLVVAASCARNRDIVQGAVPEALFVDREDEGAIAGHAAAAAVLCGPGIGTDADGAAALERVLAATGAAPIVLDADALTLLVAGRDGDGGRERERERLGELGAQRPVVLTPHPGEMARLTGRPVPELLAAPLEAAGELAARTGCTVLLKGQPSIVAAAGAATLVNTVGSSDLASAGMGDQLAGLLVAFLGAGAGVRDAAGLALFYGGRAAELARRGRSLVPDDLSAELHRAFARPGPMRSPLGPFVTFDQPPRW